MIKKTRQRLDRSGWFGKPVFSRSNVTRDNALWVLRFLVAACLVSAALGLAGSFISFENNVPQVQRFVFVFAFVFALLLCASGFYGAWIFMFKVDENKSSLRRIGSSSCSGNTEANANLNAARAFHKRLVVDGYVGCVVCAAVTMAGFTLFQLIGAIP